MNSQQEFYDLIERKSQYCGDSGFSPVWMPDFLFDFQKYLVEFAVVKGRAAIFADCGLGKGPMELVYAENIVRKTKGNFLIVAPLAVSHQVVREAEKFGIRATRSIDGTVHNGITVTNYERLKLFNPSDFAGMACNESSILKSFEGKRRQEITVFMRKMQYRFCSSATAAPNDYIELGTTSEALGYLGRQDMAGRFFKNDQNNIKARTYLNKGSNFEDARDKTKMRFKGHAEDSFWRYQNSYSRSCRRPSDVGFPDDGFVLVPLTENEHIIKCEFIPEGCLFPVTAIGLREEREESKQTIPERCEYLASLVNNTGEQAFIGCNLNEEGNLLEKLIPDAVQVAGHGMSDETKESRLNDFAEGNARVLITKDKIAALGLNLQRCNHVVRFVTHSYEAQYQFVRRCWRFGQKRPVTVDVIASEGQVGVLSNLKRKALQADHMFDSLVKHQNDALHIDRSTQFTKEIQLPSWLN